MSEGGAWREGRVVGRVRQGGGAGSLNKADQLLPTGEQWLQPSICLF